MIVESYTEKRRDETLYRSKPNDVTADERGWIPMMVKRVLFHEITVGVNPRI